MESIKHKMDTLISEKLEAEQRTIQLRNEKEKFDAETVRFEKKIIEGEKKIQVVEDELDKAMTSYTTIQEQLEVLSKEHHDHELQIGALRRRIQLVEEERERCSVRLESANESLIKTESDLEESNRMRKVAETISQDAEDNCEILEEQVLEAQELAEVSNHKYEDAVRRYKMVQSENERTLERADEFESNAQRLEHQIKTAQEKLREMENQSQINSVKEDEYETKEKKLSEELKMAESHAEFAERSVDILESKIDSLQEQLYKEKLNYRSISEKLDQTLRTMMGL